MRWSVGPNDGRTVGEILVRANADADAVREGRVFIGRRRVRSGTEAVCVGDLVDVSPRRSVSAEAVRVIARVGDLVAVDKPAGIPTIADHSGSSHALLALTALALGVGEHDLHPTSRLDREVSGVVVFARTPEAARRLSRARAEGAYERRYVALASSAPGVDRGTWDAPIGRARDPRRRAVGGRDAVNAVTRYAVCARAARGSALLAVAPMTGRTHQIRVHAAHAGAPLIGDRAYGGPARLTLASGRVVEPRRIALHAARVCVRDQGGAPFSARAPVPRDLEDLWRALGGGDSAWEAATECALG